MLQQNIQNDLSSAIEDRPAMFGPLSFEDGIGEINDSLETECLLCSDKFNLKYGKPIFLGHLLEVHRLVIADVQQIADLPKYIMYWKEKFFEKGLEYYTPFLKLPDNEKYHLLSDDLPTDKMLRNKINLECHLKKQEFERLDKNFKRKCLLCKLVFEGTRHGYVNHVRDFHNLQLGNPQNLVHIEELILMLEEKLNNLQCIFCEKTFPDFVILKEHMRKKLHKRICPENHNYDKFYIINYLDDESKYERQRKGEEETNPEEGIPDDEFIDWLEDEEFIYCLFCKVKETNLDVMYDHIKCKHHIDMKKEMEGMDFYKKIKLVNYIRKQIYDRKCPFCSQSCKDVYNLHDHMSEAQHYKVPDEKLFNQPEYYFPTFENDTLLYLIDDGDECGDNIE